MGAGAFQPSRFVAPFDALADSYDATFTNSRIGLAQRNAVWRELDITFGPGQRILEINCGSGVDAIHLASRGVKVLACDSSPRMIEVAGRRAAQAGYDISHGIREGRGFSPADPLETGPLISCSSGPQVFERRSDSGAEAPPCSNPGEKCGIGVEFRVLATEDIGTLVSEEPVLFDGALSNFAGLNCVENLAAVAGNLVQLLRPGAKALLCLFGRFCLWEILRYLARGRPDKAFRRFRAAGVAARLADGVAVRVHYPSVRNIARAFAPRFRLRKLKGIGIAVPPSYLEPWARRFPRALGLLAEADRQLERWPLIRMTADHVLLTFERTA
jgi:SAM-dependent methyltransferase